MLITATNRVLMCGSLLISVLASAWAADATPPFRADWVLPPQEQTTIGGPGGATLVLKPNLPLLDRVLIERSDLREARISLRLAPPPRGLADALASGKAADGDVVRLGELPATQKIQLSTDSVVALAIWRHQFHYHGGAELSGYTVERLSDGVSVSLPAFGDKASTETDIGTFTLKGYAKRGKLPEISDKAEVESSKPGLWSVPDAKATTITASPGSLTFHTNGAADFSKQFDWAPVVTFEPKQAGTYRVSGQLSFTSGKPSAKDDDKPMSWMLLHVSPEAGELPPSELRVHRLLRPFDSGGGTPRAGEDFDPRPVEIVPLKEVLNNKPQAVELNGLAPLAHAWLQDRGSAHGLLLSIHTRDSSKAPRVTISEKNMAANVVIRRYPSHQLFDSRVRPVEGVYTVMRDGKLWYGDNRLRLWGVVGFPDAGRLVRMGFNAQRVWEPRVDWMYDESSAKRGEIKPYVKGDGSRWDKADKHLADLKANGCFVMLGTLQNTMPLKPLLADDSFVAGGDDWAEWKKAMSAKEIDHERWVFFDERLQRARKQHAKNLLTWVNPYTGKAYGQEEAIAVYEIFNENGAAKKLLEGGFEKWPAYFKDKFQVRWNDWLRTRYANDGALTRAWGKLDEGESLAGGSVKLGPTFQQRNDYPKQRGGDFVHFVIDVIDTFNNDFRAYCRTLAPDGVGVNVAPFSFDTQYRPSMAWNFIQSRGEVNCPGMYFWNLDSSLGKPPSAYVMDSHTTEGSATIIYETNAGRPGKARAEYPLKAAALASWQDWDGVFWHYWSAGPGELDEAYLTAAMPYTQKTHFWTAVHHETDPVMTASMAMAGRMFLGYDIAPAPSPDIIEVGAEAIYSYDRYNGIGQSQRTFARGSRIAYRPEKQTGALLEGKPLPANERIIAAVEAGEQIVWDWPNARLIVDTPTVKGYAGKFTGPYKFKDGVVLSDVSTSFVAFYLVSADGKPLVGDDASRRVYISAVADAQNTGFEMDWTVQGGPIEQANAQKSWGRAPVIVDEVAYKLWLPTQIEGKFKGYDFALRERVSRPISGTNVIEHDGKHLWCAVLEIDRRGPPAAVPEVKQTTVATQTSPDAPAAAVVAGGPWNPIPDLYWTMDHHAAHKALRDSSYTFSTISKPQMEEAESKSIVMTDAEIPSLFDAAADLEIDTVKDRMQRMTVTFKNPPPLTEVMGAYEKQFGAPAHKKLGTQFEGSSARWPATKDRPAILITESQGILKIVYERGDW